jgi:DNA-binding transcriptional MerR regulator
MPQMDAVRYGIGDLADLGGVSRRTVRYYVQEGLLPSPLGVGRGPHYGPEHLQQLIRVKSLQEAGRSLDEIRGILHGRPAWPARAAEQADESTLLRSVWRRIALAPGVELHVSSGVRLPPASRLEELASWCRIYFGTPEKENSND